MTKKHRCPQSVFGAICLAALLGMAASIHAAPPALTAAGAIAALKADANASPAAVKEPSPADTMFNNAIRMAGLKALTKYHFEEGIAAAVGVAKTQGGHGSQTRTGEIMKLLIGYGNAAKPQIPELKELIANFNADVQRKEFSGGELNDRRVNSVKDAIKAIESATTQPKLRTVRR